MKSGRIIQYLIVTLILVSNIGCDQISKNYVRGAIGLRQEIHLLDKHIMFTRVENGGAFLSIGHTLSPAFKFMLLILLPFIALCVGVYFLFTSSTLSRSTAVALSFVVGGGFGNIYDRYIYGAVTDFMHVDFILFRTGIFNMADVSIMTGVFIIIASYIRNGNLSLQSSRVEERI